MEGKFIRISRLMFWPRTSPSDFHQTCQGPNCFTHEDQCNDNFPERYASNGPNLEGTNTSRGIIDFSVTKVSFCDKSKRDRVFGTFNKFRNNDVSSTKGESFGYPKQMFTAPSFLDHDYIINQTFRKACVHKSSCAPW